MESKPQELSERKKLILKAIVDAHIADGEPVGSKYLMESKQAEPLLLGYQPERKGGAGSPRIPGTAARLRRSGAERARIPLLRRFAG